MLSYLPTLNWPIYSGWTQFTPTIPKMYWNVDSQEQRIKELCCNYSKAEQYLNYIAKITNDWSGEYSKEVQAKLDEFEELVESGYEEAIEEWFRKDAFRELVNQVFFGLTDDGHFIAYIPESWNDIRFDTGFDYSLDTYGRLILRWDVDDEYPATQTPYEENRFGRY